MAKLKDDNKIDFKNNIYYRNIEDFIVSNDSTNHVEIRFERENKYKDKHLSNFVELVDIDDKKNTWTFNLGFRDYLDNSHIVHGATVNFKNMTDKYNKDFLKMLNEKVQEPWFDGRLSVVTYGVLDKNPKANVYDDMKDLFRVLNNVRREFLEHQQGLNLDNKNDKEDIKDKLGKFVYNNTQIKKEKFYKDENNYNNYFQVTRTETNGKDKNETSQRHVNRHEAILDIMEQFTKDMRKVGKFLSNKEKEAITQSFMKSLTGKQPKYEIEGVYKDSKGKNVPFKIEVEMSEGRIFGKPDNDKDKNINFPPPPPGAGAVAVQIPVHKQEVKKVKEKPQEMFPPRIFYNRDNGSLKPKTESNGKEENVEKIR